jgi:general secretion pathway protein I
MSAARSARHRLGFTLVEVLVALVIVALGMGAVLTALTSAADNTTRMREQTFAEWVGFNQLSTERLQATLPATGGKEGDVDFAGSRWHWQETVEGMDVPGLKRITVRVRHADSPQAAAKTSAANVAWLATVMGFRGDAIQSPLDVLANWDGTTAGPAPLSGSGN